MIGLYFDLCDVQLKPSVATCRRCRNDIYRYDPAASICGKLIHEECMSVQEQEEYPVYEACGYFEEAC